jgi:hypothetical protein
MGLIVNVYKLVYISVQEPVRRLCHRIHSDPMLKSALCTAIAGALMLVAARICNQAIPDCGAISVDPDRWCWEDVLADPLRTVFPGPRASAKKLALCTMCVTILLLIVIHISLSCVLIPTYTWAVRHVHKHRCMANVMTSLSLGATAIGWFLFVLFLVAIERLHGSESAVISWCISLTGVHLMFLAAWRALLCMCCTQSINCASRLSIALWIASELCVLVIGIASMRDDQQSTMWNLESILHQFSGSSTLTKETQQTEQAMIGVCSEKMLRAPDGANVITVVTT